MVPISKCIYSSYDMKPRRDEGLESFHRVLRVGALTLRE